MAQKIGGALKKLLERARDKFPTKNEVEAGKPATDAVNKIKAAGDGERIKLENGQKRPEGGAPRVALSGPLLIALSLVLVCAVAWAFFMGLMVGRGQNPHESLPAMAGMLDSGIGTEEGDKLNLGESSDLAELPRGDDTDAQGPSGVLPLPAPTPSAGVHAPPTGAAAKAWPDANAPQRARTVQPKPVKPAQNAANANQKYDFVYQAAAFRSNADASKAQKSINGKGLRATVRRSGKVYLVMVNFRGTSAEMDKMLARMKSQGMTKPLQLAKTPVEAKQPRQRKK